MASADELFEAYYSTTDPDLFQVWSIYDVQRNLFVFVCS